MDTLKHIKEIRQLILKENRSLTGDWQMNMLGNIFPDRWLIRFRDSSCSGMSEWRFGMNKGSRSVIDAPECMEETGSEPGVNIARLADGITMPIDTIVECAIMFKAPGVQIMDDGADYRYVVFKGTDATDRVFIKLEQARGEELIRHMASDDLAELMYDNSNNLDAAKEYKDMHLVWAVKEKDGTDLYRSGRLDEVIDFVERNYDMNKELISY